MKENEISTCKNSGPVSDLPSCLLDDNTIAFCYAAFSESDLQDTLSHTQTMMVRAPWPLPVGSLEYTAL